MVTFYRKAQMSDQFNSRVVSRLANREPQAQEEVAYQSRRQAIWQAWNDCQISASERDAMLAQLED